MLGSNFKQKEEKERRFDNAKKIHKITKNNLRLITNSNHFLFDTKYVIAFVNV